MPIDRIKLPDNTVHELRDITKQEILVSGTNIKTINGASLLGSGDIEIETTESLTTSEIDTIWNNAS